MENSNMKKCKHCGTEMAKSATICPKCGGKNPKPIYKRVWFWVLIVILLISLLGSSGNKSEDKSTSSNKSTTQEEAAVEYTEATVDELVDALENNALGASDTYKGKYFAVKGELSNIDSSGDYISIDPMYKDFSVYNVQCFIKTDEQLEKVKTLSVGDTITVKGKIKDVGEVMGYTMDIDSIE